jgi:hypothetical protein
MQLLASGAAAFAVARIPLQADRSHVLCAQRDSGRIQFCVVAATAAAGAFSNPSRDAQVTLRADPPAAAKRT